jgi:hypothetical protein
MNRNGTDVIKQLQIHLYYMYLLPKPYNGDAINNNENSSPDKKKNSFFEPYEYVVADIYIVPCLGTWCQEWNIGV